MIEVNTHDHSAIEERLTRQAEETCLRITAHAHQEMVEEYVKLEDVISVLSQAKVVENYPDHRRGPCCLVYGQDKSGRDLHISLYNFFRTCNHNYSL